MRNRDGLEDDFASQLKQAMGRVDAPETLARFLAAAAEVEADRALPRKERGHLWAFAVPAWAGGWKVWAGAAMTAMLMGGVFVGEQMHRQRNGQRAEQRDEERAMLAQQQFETAMGVANHALDHTQARLERVRVVPGN